MVFAMGFGTRSSGGGYVPDDLGCIGRVALRDHEFPRKPELAGRAGVRARDASQSRYARFQLRKAMRESGRTIAVLGTPLDKTYPAARGQWARRPAHSQRGAARDRAGACCRVGLPRP